ncbi:prolyl oligopeptidase family serine peptidase [Aliiglaciecola sp. LCG003]|uniref:S9 family peptidase n=1 Tax=Aliiglaciecola sp. LCG003 TaxID=3053655 RepID=UPI002572B272|nr:prolyl oligopeptidase family serine peptidase [Aliiglaciecola sp. LCG003]WJG07775.1 prolyl oligopeptidase family serine peptidase [Aliiglaciecola sp. LCG003]
MHKRLRLFLVTSMATGLLACSATETQIQPQSTNAAIMPSVPAQTFVKSAEQNQPLIDGQLSLEQIMADPDWMGRQPEQPFLSLDGSQVFYAQKRQGSEVRDLFQQPLSAGSVATKVPLNRLHQVSYRNHVKNTDDSVRAWVFQNNIFVKSNHDSQVKQLTRDSQRVANLVFLNDGRLSYQVHNAVFAINVTTGMTEQLVSWKFDDAPKAVEEPKDYIAEQQLALMSVLQKRRQDTVDRFDYNQQLEQQNQTVTADAFYLPAKHRTVEASVSPDGRFVILAIEKDESSRDDSDIMPNYVVETGRIKAESVRARVADAKPQNQPLWLLDLTSGKQHELSYTSLPGYNDDVLAAVKKENAEAKGKTYQGNRLPRDIGLLVDWGWSQSAITWHQSGLQVGIMLEAWDNKDRWLATVDLAKKTLVNQHRLHDDAWINYNFNSFGWLKSSQTLYYLSEQSGYSHLYTKPINGKEKAITSGRYEVDNITLSSDDNFIYFKANKKHPGIYEIYRANLANGEIEALTDLNGMTDYQLNEQQNSLLLSHSKLTSPPELFVQPIGAKKDPVQLTHTASEAFNNINWTLPEIVPIKSSHVQQPVYSRLYLPANHDSGEKRRAVVFNHGAGYLQNSHLGWSGYFREFMFHNLLVQKGYVVLDMDYRASAGYGRDWRTAIYRHMGKPETEDLVDGVNWMVENVNVDRQRIGTYGGSYGGFMTFMALFTEPDLFQAGAALRPVSDWAHYNHGYTSNILNMPDVDPIAYERSSPIYFAQGLEKPLLINAPMVDSNVFFVDVVRLVQRLIELEKQDFETAIYPVESHGFLEPSSWLDEYRRIFKLFEQNL